MDCNDCVTGDGESGVREIGRGVCGRPGRFSVTREYEEPFRGGWLVSASSTIFFAIAFFLKGDFQRIGFPLWARTMAKYGAQ